MILDKIVNIYRLTQDINDTDKERYDLAIEGARMNIQPVTPEYELVVGDGSFGKSFNAFTTQSGIENTMLITVSGTTTVSGYKYLVTGIQNWSAPDLIPHYELVLSKLDD